MSEQLRGFDKIETERKKVAGFEIAMYEDGSSAIMGRVHTDGYTQLERQLMVSANVMRRRYEAGLVRSRRAASGKWFIEDVGGGLIGLTDSPIGDYQEDVELAQNILDVAMRDETVEPVHRAPDTIEPQDIGRRAIGGPGTDMPLFIFKS
jgi:hypothetical protein